MLFKKTYGELVQSSLSYLASNTSITNTNAGGITRAIIEIINKNISEYYDILDINMAASFLSTSNGYYLDMIGSLFNMPRVQATQASASVTDETQKFYVASGTLFSKIPSGIIPSGTIVSTGDSSLTYVVTADTSFSNTDKEVYVSIRSTSAGARTNIGAGVLVNHSLGISGVFTTNVKSITSGTNVESDSNYKFRIMNATLSAEKANMISVRLAALSVSGVADVVIKPYSRGIGTYDVIVIPVSGIAGDALIESVQGAIDQVTAAGNKGSAIKPSVVPVNIEVALVLKKDVTDYDASQIKARTVLSIQDYIVNIPIGGTFVLNAFRQKIMDTDTRITDHVINCYYFRGQPTFVGNVDIYWDELFYPDPSMPNAIRVI
jgi:uncharacterized phage protein gp47/JayE